MILTLSFPSAARRLEANEEASEICVNGMKNEWNGGSYVNRRTWEYSHCSQLLRIPDSTYNGEYRNLCSCMPRMSLPPCTVGIPSNLSVHSLIRIGTRELLTLARTRLPHFEERAFWNRKYGRMMPFHRTRIKTYIPGLGHLSGGIQLPSCLTKPSSQTHPPLPHPEVHNWKESSYFIDFENYRYSISNELSFLYELRET